MRTSDEIVENPAAPPNTLTGVLELDARLWSSRDLYHLQAALVVPRPIAWVSTVAANGVRNLAPHSYFNAVCDDPPCVMFSIEGRSDTYLNLLEVPEFVVNFVTPELAEQMELTACQMPPEEDEFRWANVTPSPAKRIRPSRVAEAKASLECRTFDIKTLGKTPNYVVFGEVVHFSVVPDIWSNGRVDPELYRPIGRLSGRYVTHGAGFKMSRPSWPDVQNKGLESALDLVRKTPIV
jgi:flavin reductase (DIM6/NTAB) family NADH-FMN oxidoreductase RutF